MASQPKAAEVDISTRKPGRWSTGSNERPESADTPGAKAGTSRFAATGTQFGPAARLTDGGTRVAMGRTGDVIYPCAVPRAL